MALKGTTNEEKIWNFLKDKGLNEYGVAGLMGNLQAESGLRSNNLENIHEKRLGMTDVEYTQAVDSGTYTNFVKDSAGYGLAQWTWWTRKRNLYEYAKQCKKSIADLEMQLNFLWSELNKGYKSVLNVLKTAKTVLDASNAVLFYYEAPANQGAAVQASRAKLGQNFYDKYANNDSGSSSSTTNSGLNVGDIVTFTGSVHYTSSAAGADGLTCKPGKAKITKISKGQAHPYHLVHTGKDSTVYGWVDVADIEGAINIGDIVDFAGNLHYTSSYSGGLAKNCKPGKAKITKISKGQPHPYHLVAVSGKGSTVNGWVDASDVR